jgi:hypothetical protein
MAKSPKTISKRLKKRLHETMRQKDEKKREKWKKVEEKYLYNPPPVRRELLSKQELDVKKGLEKKEKKRNETGKTSFSGWEYKDRQSHKKTS